MSSNKHNKKTFAVGDKVHHERYGNGVCQKVDLQDPRSTYMFKFEDETRIWMGRSVAVETVEHGHTSKKPAHGYEPNGEPECDGNCEGNCESCESCENSECHDGSFECGGNCGGNYESCESCENSECHDGSFECDDNCESCEYCEVCNGAE